MFVLASGCVGVAGWGALLDNDCMIARTIWSMLPSWSLSDARNRFSDAVVDSSSLFLDVVDFTRALSEEESEEAFF